MTHYLEEYPDQTALELLVEFRARYPGRYSLRQLNTLQKRVRKWRQQAIQRLIAEVGSHEFRAPLMRQVRQGIQIHRLRHFSIAGIVGV